MFILYGMRVSPRSLRVLWALEEAGAAYEHVEVDVRRGETRTPEFLRVNPLGTVPALAHGGFTLCESNAILGYIADVAGASLAFASPAERARAHQWMFWEASAIGEPLHHAWLAAFRARGGGAPDPAARERALDACRAPLAALDAHLARREHVAADRFGVADVAIASSLAQCDAAGIDLAPWPDVAAYLRRAQARPGYRRTWGDAR